MSSCLFRGFAATQATNTQPAGALPPQRRRLMLRISDYAYYLATIRPVQAWQDYQQRRSVAIDGELRRIQRARVRSHRHSADGPNEEMARRSERRARGAEPSKVLRCAHASPLQHSRCYGLESGLASGGLFALRAASLLTPGSQQSRETSSRANHRCIASSGHSQHPKRGQYMTCKPHRASMNMAKPRRTAGLPRGRGRSAARRDQMRAKSPAVSVSTRLA